MILAVLVVSAGADVYGLVLRETLPVVFLLVSATYLNRHRRIPQLRRVHKRQMKLVAAGSVQMYGVGAAELGYMRVPMLAVQSLYGTDMLGLFAQSTYLATSVNRIMAVVNQQIGLVFFSAFRKDTRKTKKGWTLLLFLSAALSIPAAVLFYCFPTQVVATLFGHQWISAVPILKHLSFVVILLPICTIVKSRLYGERKNNIIILAYLIGTLTFTFILLLPVDKADGRVLVAAALTTSYVFMLVVMVLFLIQNVFSFRKVTKAVIRTLPKVLQH
jgi:O-antigen/teichoic acid export membrane protein